MSASSSHIPETPPDHLHDGAEPCAHCGASAAEVQDAERFAMLREVADGGMEFTRAMRGQLRVLTQAEPDPVSGEPTKSIAVLGMAYSRVARTVRQTLALEVRFEEGRKAKERPSDAEAAWRQEMEGAGERLRAKLAAVGFYPTRPQGYVEAEDADEEERRENLADRPDADDREGFGPDRPVGEVLAGVCADLGIERDLSIWAKEDIEGDERDAPSVSRLKAAASSPVARVSKRDLFSSHAKRSGAGEGDRPKGGGGGVAPKPQPP